MLRDVRRKEAVFPTVEIRSEEKVNARIDTKERDAADPTSEHVQGSASHPCKWVQLSSAQCDGGKLLVR